MNGWSALGFESYQDYLESYLWKNKRDWIIQLANFKCQNCGSNKGLVVHHINYNSVGNESIEDVEVLCKKCHSEKHKEDENGRSN